MRTLRIGSMRTHPVVKNDYSRDYDANRAHQVGKHVLESAFNIHAVLGRPMENPGHDQVDQQAPHPDKKHRPPIYIDVFTECPVVRLEHDPACDHP